MSEVKNIPRLRFPEFYGSWEKKKLEDVGKIRMCKRIFNHQTSVNGDIPFYKIGTFGREPDSYISKELYHDFKHKYSYPKVGDILISAAGTLGRTVVFDGSPSYFQDSNIVWIDNKENLITNEFLYYIYKIVRYESEGGTIQRLYNSIIYNAKFWKPSLPEQQKIADFLTAVDKRIELLEKKKTLLETYKKGVMKKIFDQEIRFKDDNGNDFPDWEEKRLGEISKITTGRLDANAMVDGGQYRFYTCAKDYYHIDNFSFDTDALIISGNGANVGYIHHYKGKFNAYQRTYVLDGFEESILYVKFFLDRYLKARIESEKKEGNTPYIVKSTLEDMKIQLPTFLEQIKISEFLSSIDNQFQLIETQIEKSKTWKKGLLQKMFV